MHSQPSSPPRDWRALAVSKYSLASTFTTYDSDSFILLLITVRYDHTISRELTYNNVKTLNYKISPQYLMNLYATSQVTTSYNFSFLTQNLIYLSSHNIIQFSFFNTKPYLFIPNCPMNTKNTYLFTSKI